MKEGFKHFVHDYRHRLIIAAIATAAIVLCFMTNLSCQFVHVDLTSSRQWDVPDTDTYQAFGLGLWRRQRDDLDNDGTADEKAACVNWTPSDVWYDASWKGSRVFCTVACILGCMALFFSCWATCIQSRCVEKWTACLLLAAMLLQVVTFSVYGSTVCRDAVDGCRWNQGSTYSLVTAVLYLVAGLYELLLPKCERRIHQQEEQVEEERSENLTATMRARAYLAKRDADEALEEKDVPP